MKPTRTTPSRSRSRATAAVVGAGLVVAATLGTPAGAATTSVTLTDPAGDVWASGEGETAEQGPAGDAPTADVVSASAQHRRRSVVVQMDFVDLRREDPAFYSATVITPDRLRAAFVETGPRRWSGKHMLLNGNYRNVRCSGFDHTVDYDADRVVMTVPRSCLGRPRWVRVSMANYQFQGETEETFRELSDNPHGDDPDGGTTGRIYRAP